MVTNNSNNTYIVAPSTHEVTQPEQPMFYASQNSATPNVTGGGATYVYGTDLALTEVFDQGSNFYIGNGSGAAATFTAPVTGKYFFSISARLTDLTASTTDGCLYIKHNSSNYAPLRANVAEMRIDGHYLTISGSIIRSLTASDTVTFSIKIDNGSNTVDLGGGSPKYTYCSGFLIG